MLCTNESIQNDLKELLVSCIFTLWIMMVLFDTIKPLMHWDNMTIAVSSRSPKINILSPLQLEMKCPSLVFNLSLLLTI